MYDTYIGRICLGLGYIKYLEFLSEKVWSLLFGVLEVGCPNFTWLSAENSKSSRVKSGFYFHIFFPSPQILPLEKSMINPCHFRSPNGILFSLGTRTANCLCGEITAGPGLIGHCMDFCLCPLQTWYALLNRYTLLGSMNDRCFIHARKIVSILWSTFQVLWRGEGCGGHGSSAHIPNFLEQKETDSAIPAIPPLMHWDVFSGMIVLFNVSRFIHAKNHPSGFQHCHILLHNFWTLKW